MFGKSWVQVSGRRATILTEVPVGDHSVPTEYIKSGHDRFLTYPHWSGCNSMPALLQRHVTSNTRNNNEQRTHAVLGLTVFMYFRVCVCVCVCVCVWHWIPSTLNLGSDSREFMHKMESGLQMTRSVAELFSPSTVHRFRAYHRLLHKNFERVLSGRNRWNYSEVLKLEVLKGCVRGFRQSGMALCGRRPSQHLHLQRPRGLGIMHSSRTFWIANKKGSTFVRNVGNHVPNVTVPHSRRYSSPCRQDKGPESYLSCWLALYVCPTVGSGMSVAV